MKMVLELLSSALKRLSRASIIPLCSGGSLRYIIRVEDPHVLLPRPWMEPSFSPGDLLRAEGIRARRGRGECDQNDLMSKMETVKRTRRAPRPIPTGWPAGARATGCDAEGAPGRWMPGRPGGVRGR